MQVVESGRIILILDLSFQQIVSDHLLSKNSEDNSNPSFLDPVRNIDNNTSLNIENVLTVNGDRKQLAPKPLPNLTSSLLDPYYKSSSENLFSNIDDKSQIRSVMDSQENYLGWNIQSNLSKYLKLIVIMIQLDLFAFTLLNYHYSQLLKTIH